MRLRLIPRKEDIVSLPPGEWEGATAVVIDVLRATSTIAAALAHGAEAVHPCLDRAEAEARAAALPPENRLLCGEKGALKIPGFDLGNSPRDFTPDRVRGREVVLVTTNGTRAVRLLPAGVRSVFLGSLLNGGAVARFLAFHDEEAVVLVCSGTVGCFSFDDFLGAGQIVDGLEAAGVVAKADDYCLAARDAFRQNRYRLPEALAECGHAAGLAAVGLGEDIGFCARRDALDVVPLLRGERVVDVSPRSTAGFERT